MLGPSEKPLSSRSAYIQSFGKTVLIKLGGHAMNDSDLEKLVQDIVLMKLVGMNPALVHGGGRDQ